MAHPQNSPRGLFAKKAINLNSTSTMSVNSTGLIFGGAVFVSGQTATGKLSANSTALLVPSTGFQFAALTSLKMTSNSTGIKVGARYISTNTTGNSTT